jgi:hypothetical protein
MTITSAKTRPRRADNMYSVLYLKDGWTRVSFSGSKNACKRYINEDPEGLRALLGHYWLAKGYFSDPIH